ncbi:N-acetylmuramoyl-L-alanine amidase [Rummeliibacillus sp. TYF005]|uniref:N-acetylmuramoyl-L-alanine amidase n=1 Tax=Rummeliibacillus sp. TYF005 TaxID=2058214 RepID=UPI000F54A319|nr:N-acetylmuramoyl-L-alanine amidase [Rummeliibacillus sp. TYF005]RPJ97301.1 N-acetylmuramoyl-L-alanine amidase [Rummeliibacillus sp. TYF005]
MTKQFVISSGHGDKVSGAIGILNEHNEAKKVVNRVYSILVDEYNGKGYKYHETTATNQNQNLANIVSFHNGKTRDLDISVHFNSASASATGTECLYYDAKSLSAKMSKAMANALGIVDRGAKERKELYFLRNTSKPAILLEVCFVTSKKDAAAYHENFEDLCQAIAKVIANELGYKKKVTTVSKPSVEAPSYYKSGTGLYRIKKNCYAYRSVIFDKENRVELCQKGTKYTIVAIVKYGSTYRLKTKWGMYITANKEYVEKV